MKRIAKIAIREIENLVAEHLFVVFVKAFVKPLRGQEFSEALRHLDSQRVAQG
jgi:hypothetical protein